MVSVLVVVVIVTAISAYLGYSMHMKNNRNIMNKIISVEICDLCENLAYDLELGKDIDNIYDLDKKLTEQGRLFGNIDGIYVVDGTGKIFASNVSGSKPLPETVGFQNNGYFEDDGHFFTISSINDELKVVTVSGTDFVSGLDEDYIYKLINISIIGGMLILILIIVLYMLVKDLDKVRKTVTVIIAAWVLLQGAYICYANYSLYNNSITKIENTIEGIFQYDLKKITDRGVDVQYISGYSEYLERYSRNVEEISDISENNGELVFAVSRTYMNRVIMGYILQTILVFFFSMVTLGESRIFITEVFANGGISGSKSD